MTAEPTRWATRLYDAYVFDMDGTIYLGDHLLPGARRLIEELRERNIPVRFLTNNPTKDLHQYADKLTALGLPTPVEDIVGTVATTTSWLLEHKPGQVVFPIAEEPLIAVTTRRRSTSSLLPTIEPSITGNCRSHSTPSGSTVAQPSLARTRIVSAPSREEKVSPTARPSLQRSKPARTRRPRSSWASRTPKWRASPSRASIWNSRTASWWVTV